MPKLADLSEGSAPYKRILFSAEEVDARIREMAGDIIGKYDPNTTVFVGLLNGALPFQTKLMFAIAERDPSFHPNSQAMVVSRYDEENQPGALRLVADLPPKHRDLDGKTIVLLDDLIDEGYTLEFAIKHLLGYGAAAVDPVVLVKKEKDDSVIASRTLHDAVVFGFPAPDVWLTGMGMDDSRLRRSNGDMVGGEGNRWAGWIAEAH